MSTTSGTPWRWCDGAGGPLPAEHLAEAGGADHPIGPVAQTRTVAKATWAPDATFSRASAT